MSYNPNPVNNNAPAIVPDTVQGAVDQSANLSEWKNSAGDVVASMSPIGALTYKGKLTNTLVVGPNGHYATLKEAVDYFNTCSSNTEIILDAGNHLVASTITVSNSSYELRIRGSGSNVTTLSAAAALSSSPMFNFASNCDITAITCDGSSATGNCNCITFDTTAGIYSEITDIIIDTFAVGVADLKGVDIFLFNFVIAQCTTGVHQYYTTNSGTATNLDIETGNFEHCTTSVHLQQGAKCNFTFINLIFKQQVSPAATAILYDGTQYVVADVCNIFSCTWNNVGTFESGFDFTLADGRDANIEFISNVGIEDEKPHAKINVVDNTVTTSITNGNTYYKLLGVNSKYSIVFNLAATAGNFTISYHGQTTGNIAYNASAATIKSALEALTNITTVTVVQIVASKEWTVEFLTAGEGWVPSITVNIAGLTTTTLVTINDSFYTAKMGITNNRLTQLSIHDSDAFMIVSGNLSCDQTNRNVNIGLKKNNTGSTISPMTCRTATANVAYPFSMVLYLDDIEVTDYFELFVSSTSSGDVVRLWDLNWFYKAM